MKENISLKQNKKILIIVPIIVLIVAIIIFCIFLKINSSKEVVEEVPLNGSKQYEVISNEVTKNENVNILEDGKKVNTSEAVKTKKQIKDVDGIEVEVTTLDSKNSMTTFRADAINTTDSDIPATRIWIKFVNKNNEVMYTFYSTLADTKAGEKTQLYISANIDMANAYDVVIEKTI